MIIDVVLLIIFIIVQVMFVVDNSNEIKTEMVSSWLLDSTRQFRWSGGRAVEWTTVVAFIRVTFTQVQNKCTCYSSVCSGLTNSREEQLLR